MNALIDFEIWCVGDPRVDLAWLCMHLQSARLPTAERDVPGLPTDEAVLDAYVAAGGTPPSDMAWFHAFAQFKGAGMVGQLVKHNRRNGRPSARISGWDPNVPPRWLHNARQLLGSD